MHTVVLKIVLSGVNQWALAKNRNRNGYQQLAIVVFLRKTCECNYAYILYTHVFQMVFQNKCFEGKIFVLVQQMAIFPFGRVSFN